MAPFSIFDITPVGLVAAAVGAVTMLTLGRRLLPDREGGGLGADSELVYLSHVVVVAEGKYTRRPIGAIADFNRSGLTIKAARIGGKFHRTELGELTLAKGDFLVVKSGISELLTLNEQPELRVGLPGGAERAKGKLVVEAVVAPHRATAGSRIADLHLDARFGVRVLGAHRHQHEPGPDLENVRLRPADKLLLEGSAASLDALAEEGSLVSATRASHRPYRRGKAPIAMLALIAVVTLAALNVMDIGILAMIAVAAILFLRCIDADEAWHSVNGSLLVLIFAMLIVGTGLQRSGAVELIVGAAAPYLVLMPPFVALIAMYMLTSLLTELVTNNAVAVIMAPIAIALALELGVDPRAFLIAVMMGASATFATPIGYQTNTLVYGAGNYRFTDFLKVGVPMNVIVGSASCLAIYFFFPL